MAVKTLAFPDLIDHICQGESDHLWDHVLKRSKSKFNIRNGTVLLWNLFSIYIAYESNLIFNSLGNDGADQIPNFIPSLNNWLAGPASYGVNYCLSLFLTVLLAHEYEKSYQHYKLSKALQMPISKCKMVAKEISSFVIAGFAATPFWIISKKEKSLRTEAFTFGEYTIQSYFGAEPLLKEIIWKVTGINCKKRGILDDNFDDDDVSLKETTLKLKALKNKLLSNHMPIIDVSDNPQPAEIKQYIIENIPLTYESKYTPDANKLNCLDYVAHFIMQLSALASNVGYSYDTAHNLEIEDPILKGIIAGAGITAFTVLGVIFVYRTTNTFLNIGRDSFNQCREKCKKRKDKNAITQSPLERMSPLDSHGKPLLEESNSDVSKEIIDKANQAAQTTCSQTIISSLMWFCLISSYFFAYYSSASCLKLNKDTGWSFATGMTMRLLACLGTTLFNGYSLMETTTLIKSENEMRNIPENKRAILHTLDKVIEYLEYVDKNKTSDPIQIRIR